jgi:OFA family oxalate/formate antiporter-like MFS transporter
MVKTWQYFALVLMFIGTTQSCLLIIAFAAPLATPLLGASAWALVSFGGLVNAFGRVGTGMYSDKIGRSNAFTLNCAISALCLFMMPTIIGAKSIFLLFVAVGIAYWQYGGGLALMPSFTADFFGPKNLGFNYGLVFIGWGLGFFMARLGGTIRDITGSLDWAFYLSGLVIVIGAEMNAEIEHASPHGKDPGEKVAGQKRRIPIGSMRRWIRVRRAHGEKPPSAKDVETALSDRTAR